MTGMKWNDFLPTRGIKFVHKCDGFCVVFAVQPHNNAGQVR